MKFRYGFGMVTAVFFCGPIVLGLLVFIMNTVTLHQVLETLSKF